MTPRLVRSAAAEFATVDGKDGFWDRFEAGTWEPETLAAVRRLAAPGVTLVDIGGWIGPITLTALALGARAVTFEPDPRAHELLAANLAANPDFTGRSALHHRAVAPTGGSIRLGSPRKLGDSMGSVLLVEGAAATFEAETLTPAAVASLAGEGPRILKIDIEGAEYDVLPHLAPLLGDATHAALVAFHPRILASTGVAQDEIERRTGAALATFAAFRMTVIDGAGLTSANVTALFERA